MEHLLKLHIEYLPEGVYLATSEDIQPVRRIHRQVIRQRIEKCRRLLT
jgi:hypothetical protein